MNHHHHKLERILAWRRKYISERHFIIIVSALVGIVSGLAAVALKETVHFIHHNFTSEDFDENLLQLTYPVIGLTKTVLLAKILYKEKVLGHAITDILYSIAKKSGVIEKSKMYSRLITSAITVGFGGSVGLESPIVLSGSAIGSNIAGSFKLNYKLKNLMIGCGTAGVISAIFNAPIAGLIFSIEVILIGMEVSVTNFIPLLIASVCATLVSDVLLGSDILFSFRLIDSFQSSDTLYYMLFGVVCGFTAMYFSYVMHAVEDQFKKVENKYTKALIGGIFLSGMIYLCPPVYGEGYGIIKALLNGNEYMVSERSSLFSAFTDNEWYFLGYIILNILTKAFASAVTIGAGGSGGTFAPSLFLGGLTGFAYSRFINLADIGTISEPNFILVGMCGVLCGKQYAPLTSIFLIAELTGGYTLFIPLMLVSAITYSTVSYFEPFSVYVRELMARDDMKERDTDSKVLDKLNIDKIIETDLKTIHYGGTLKDLVQVISVSRRNIFPVVDDEKKLVGIVTLDNVRHMMFDPEQQENVEIISVMENPADTINYGDGMDTIMNKFETTQAWNLPILKEGKYYGFVSKSRIFTFYRKQLKRS